ncbi:DUF3253 domain-containing protein [Brevifollis gellanilyticus]|uniref:S-adenosylmethionine tRNA ribosyltransferase n=1 Tax=Brevifollis gellanilyticus TaxID=748831 RepID=A0A512M511_9BACT|nr:DUF3253 domain-containing protein [Brevifollis gellanilyticus]GEP41818.1 hypothetical protein BGE01nite_11090 [Brevifollis gellanilyticus]
MSEASDIRRTFLEFAAARSDGATFCPSEVARKLSKDWRPLMPKVRDVAAQLIEDGKLVCTQRGKPAHPLKTSGAIRLARPG